MIMSYNNSSYFFSHQKQLDKVNVEQEALVSTFLQLLYEEFGREYLHYSYADYELGCRVAVIFDLDGEELVRIHLGGSNLIILNKKTQFEYISNYEKQLEKFWINLYEKYKINKNEFYKRHKIKKLFN